MNSAVLYRCVKCKGGHGPGECSRNKNDAEEVTQLPPPYCVLCKTEGHAASYRSHADGPVKQSTARQKGF